MRVTKVSTVAGSVSACQMISNCSLCRPATASGRAVSPGGVRRARVRALILEAEPDVVEEWKWDVPVWSHDGIVCTGESYKAVVKLTFARGASLPDPKKLFNASLEGNTRRAIDIRQGGRVDAKAFIALVKAAVAANGAAKKKR